MHLLQLALLFLSPIPFTICHQRPFYVIGHQVNNVSLIRPFLDKGSNVLEVDVHFKEDGSVKELFHGFPCDFGRRCNDRADLAVFLDKVRDLTDSVDGYYDQLAMLFFDMKLETSGNKTRSAVDILDHLLGHLWKKNNRRKQQIRVLLYIENEKNSDFVLSFTNELKRRQLDHLSKNIGFDGGTGDIAKIRQMFEEVAVTSNVWLGDGITNVLRPFWDNRRLKRLLDVRDSSGSDGFLRKVYDWTVDKKMLMRNSLRLGVDGMITNQPELMVDVLKEPEFRKGFRLATVEDDCFERFEGKTA